MPAHAGQGQGHETEEKIRGFRSIFETNLKVAGIIFRRSNRRLRYFHFDLNGGSGFNDEVGVIGSPVLFSELARSEGVPFRMHASEIDRTRATRLGHCLESCDSSYVHCGDNAELAGMIPDVIRHCGENPLYAIGTVLIDPNGIKRGVPWKELKATFEVCPRLDVVINYNATAAKRTKATGCVGDLILLNDLPKAFQKKHWLIRKPRGEWQFTVVVGRNADIGGHRAINLYEWGSPEGKECLRIATMTTKERAATKRTLF